MSTDVMRNSLKKLFANYLLPWGVIVSAFVFLIASGVMGIGQGQNFGFDFEMIYSAGEMLWEGSNFWLELLKSPNPYAYGPHSAVFIGFYAIINFENSLLFHTVVSFLCLIVIALISNSWFIKYRFNESLTLTQGICVALVIGQTFNAVTIYMGQVNIIFMASAALFWNFHKTSRVIYAGLFLAICTIKPQMSIFFIFWLLLEKQIKVLCVGAAMSVLMMLPALIQYGVVDSFISWNTAMTEYFSYDYNAIGSSNVFGVKNILFHLGVYSYIWDYILFSFSAGLVFLLHKNKEAISEISQFNILLLIPLIFIYGHWNDFSSCSILFSYSLFLAFKSQSKSMIVFVGFILLLLLIPKHFIVISENAKLFGEWKTPLLMFLLVLTIRLEKTVKKLTI